MSNKAPVPGYPRTLAEAQQLLLARRAELHQAREKGDTTLTCGDPSPPQRSTHNPTNERQNTIALAFAGSIANLPEHLGWGSVTLTRALRAAALYRQTTSTAESEGGRRWHEGVRRQAAEKDREVGEAVADVTLRPLPTSVTLPPSLGLAILRKRKAAVGRLWLLLRALDDQGRGMVTISEARKVFSASGSPHRFCGPRRLRGLLAQGEGLFWTADKERIWLRSGTRLAAALGLERFHGRDVAIPLTALSGGISQVRANLLAAFHSSRNARPVSRQTLARLSGVAPRTQRHYDQVSGVRAQRNIARGPRLESEAVPDLAWRHGSASFVWTERRREPHAARRRYLAWQIPNSYHGPHVPRGRGGRKRRNKALADLLNKGTAGNDQMLNDACAKRYFAHARAAAAAANRTANTIYWPTARSGRWHALWPLT